MVTLVKATTGGVNGGGDSGVKVSGMPRKLPLNVPVYSVTFPLTTSGSLVICSR